MEAYVVQVQDELTALIRDLVAIPAPSGQERARAQFCCDWFRRHGGNASIDAADNVLLPVNVDLDGTDALDVIMAHTDTVFPDTTGFAVRAEGGFLCAPGIVDDTANLAVMMVCARFFLASGRFPAGRRGILFVADSGEEGLGNLRGCREIMTRFGCRIAEFVALDSPDLRRVVTRSVGSHRYRVQVRTTGGHSFADFGRRNAIDVLAELIVRLKSAQLPQEEGRKTTSNVGVISGGSSVNAIAQSAEMLYEYRSESQAELLKLSEFFRRTVSEFRSPDVAVTVEMLGDRPGAGNVDPVRSAQLLERCRAAVRAVTGKGILPESGSTDCNLPLAAGIPAICFGVCRGTGTHTREEKLDVSSLSDGCRLLLDFICRR